MHLSFFILFIINELISNICSSEKFIQADYVDIIGAYYMFLKNPIDESLLLMVMDIDSQYTRIRRKSYQIKDIIDFLVPVSSNQTMIINDDLTLKGDEYSISLGIGIKYKTLIDNLSIVLSQDDNDFFIRDSALAFSYQIVNKKQSLIYLLKQNGTIDHMAFSFQKIQADQGVVYFGDVPQSEIVNKYKQTINVLGNSNKWFIPLSYLFVGEISYVYENIFFEVDSNAKTSFETNSDMIEIPEAAFNSIVDIFFKDDLKTKQCSMRLSNQQIECRAKFLDYSKYPNITFIIDSLSFKLESRFLFDIEQDIASFSIMKSKTNDWKIGTAFLNKFLTTFDYDSHCINIYSNTTFDVIDLNILFPKKFITKSIIIIILIIIFCFGLYFIRICLKSRRNKKYNKVIEEVYSKI